MRQSKDGSFFKIDRKKHWKLWELVNMGVVLSQPQSLWEDGYGRGLTKGGGKLGSPAFFSFKAVTTQKKKHSRSQGWVCCLQGETLLYSWWCSDNLNILFLLLIPFPLALHTRTAHVFLIDMESFVHLRIFLFLLVSVAQVLIVSSQTSGKWTPSAAYVNTYCCWW